MLVQKLQTNFVHQIYRRCNSRPGLKTDHALLDQHSQSGYRFVTFGFRTGKEFCRLRIIYNIKEGRTFRQCHSIRPWGGVNFWRHAHRWWR